MLSILYALLMVAVFVGIIISIIEDGPSSPTAMVFFFVHLCYLVAALLHPQEFGCIPNYFIYWITIPSMYLFLMIYSVFNLHVVSWGTRGAIQS